MGRAAPAIALGERGTERLLAACAVFFCALQVRHDGLLYATNAASWAGQSASALTEAALLLSAIAFAISGIPDRGPRLARGAIGLITLAALALAFSEALVPLVSPKPWIDVWYSNSAAVDHFLSGRNPYSEKYLDIYSGKYGYGAGFFYLPGTLFWSAPFKVLLGDIRFALVFANWMTAAALFYWARPGRPARQSLVPALAALLWLSFPVTLFVIEQAWVDTALIPGALLMLLALREERWRLAGIVTGVFLSLKQYAFVAAGFGALWVWRTRGFGRAWRIGAVALGVFLLVVAPFVLLDPAAFYAMTVSSQASQGIRADALNFVAYLSEHFGRIIPGWGRIILALLGAFNGALMLLRGKEPGSERVAAASFAAYGFAFVFGKWAFCNYYFFLAAFLLAWLTGTRKLAPAPVPPAAPAL